MAIFRTAREQDLPRVLELYRQLSFDPAAEISGLSPDEYRRIFEEMNAVPGYELVVAEEDGTIIGTLVLAILPGLSHGGSPFAVVEYVVVDEPSRGRGIGRGLMEYAVAKAGQSGCYKIMLTSDIKRNEAYGFYRSLGFEASAHGFRLYF